MSFGGTREQSTEFSIRNQIFHPICESFSPRKFPAMRNLIVKVNSQGNKITKQRKRKRNVRSHWKSNQRPPRVNALELLSQEVS